MLSNINYHEERQIAVALDGFAQAAFAVKRPMARQQFGMQLGLQYSKRAQVAE